MTGCRLDRGAEVQKFLAAILAASAAACVILESCLSRHAFVDDDVANQVVATSVPEVAVIGVTGSLTANAKFGCGGAFSMSRNVAFGSASDFAASSARSGSAVRK